MFVSVRNHEKRMYDLEGVKLLPGLNSNVDEAMWKKAKSHPVVKNLIDAGKVEEVLTPKASVGKGSNQQSVVDLTKMQPKAAIELVKDTIEVLTLQAWKKIEKRKTVVSAIDAQLKELAAPPQYRGEKTDDSESEGNEE